MNTFQFAYNMTKVNNGKTQSALDQYVRNTVTEIRKYTDRKIIVRPIRCPLLNLSVLNKVGYEVPKQITNTYDDSDLSFYKRMGSGKLQ